MRDNRNRSDKSNTNGRAVSVTHDFGKTWIIHSTDHGALPEPVCMASLLSHTLSNGEKVLFFSNPNSKRRREMMTVRVSLDDGKTWPTERSILLDVKGERTVQWQWLMTTPWESFTSPLARTWSFRRLNLRNLG